MKNMTNKRTFILWMNLLTLALLLAGCGALNEKVKNKDSHEEATSTLSANQTLTIAYTWTPKGLDPHGNDSWHVMRSGTGETLIRLNEQLQPTPWLAKEWEQKEATTWVFKLEKNVTFHNGKEMDAASVKESLLRSLHKNQRAQELLQIESINVLTQHELEIKTKQPNPALIPHLADPSTIIADVMTIQDENSYPALTGAFKFKQFNKDELLIVERYRDYWGKPALLSEVTIKFITDGNTRLMALQSGDVDVATDVPITSVPLLEKDKRFQVLSAPSLRTHMVLFNMQSPLFEELIYRKVVDMNIPREAIVKSVMSGYGTEANSPFPDVLPFGKVERNTGNESVEQLMEKGGWQKNSHGIWEKQGKPFEATLLTFPQRPELSIMAEIIQSELLNKGIKVNIRQVENIDDALTKNDWDLSMYSMLTAHTGDPQYFLNIFYKSGSESNVSHYVSNSLDLAISQLNHTSETTIRNQLAIQAQAIINADLPQSFIVHPKTIMGVKREVQEFIPHPIEYYYIHSQIHMN